MSRRPFLLAGLFVCAAGLVHALVRDFYAVEPPALAVEASPPLRRALAPRAILLIIDGLREDTAFRSGCMPGLERRAAEHPSGVSLATEITMTAVGVKAIGAGVSSGLWSIAHNWSQSSLAVDSPIRALRELGRRVVVIGNHTWIDLFGGELDGPPGRDRMARLFHTIDPVYGADLILSRQAEQLAARSDWDLLVVHFGGLDNASHLWSPGTAPFCEKARDVDRMVTRVLDAAAADTAIVVTSDHGTGPRGHHGSGEPEARRTPLVLLGPPFRGSALEVNQRDLAPTLAVVLGLRLPAAAEGRARVESLALSDEEALIVKEADRARAQRYADVLGAREGVEVPRLSSAAELAPWLASARRARGWLAVAWALALATSAAFLLGWSPIGPMSAIVIGALELLAVAWRRSSRAVEIAAAQALAPLGSAREPVLIIAAAVAGLALGWRARRLLAPVVVLFVLSIVGGDLWLPLGVALALAGAASVETPRARALSVALLVVFAAVLVVRDASAPSAALPWVDGLPPRFVHGALYAGALAIIACGLTGAGPRRMTAIGLGAAALVAALSTGGQLAPLALLVGALWCCGASTISALGATLAIVGARLLFVWLFERQLSFASLEIQVGYVANPGQNHVVGAIAVVIKLVLPTLAATALVLRRATAQVRADALLGVVAFHAFRLLHVTLAICAAQGTFYGPYADVGHVVFQLLFFCAALVALLVLRPRL